MKIVGIVGGIASGKTCAAQLFREHGAVVLDADKIGHQVLRETEIRKAAEKRWGKGIIDAEGQIDRKHLAKLVFGNKEELAFLEKLTHPHIREQILAEIDGLRQSGVYAVILDAALLLEAGWQSMCEKIVFIETSPENREKRADDRGWTKEELIQRESQQLSLEKKRALADYTIRNNGSMEDLRQEICLVWDSLQAREMAD